jgi:hypothetical protein
MASLVLAGDTSGSITVAAPAVAGSNTQTLVAATDTLAPIIRGTAVTCAGQTSIDFTSIPSWVKRITVMFNGVSSSGSSPFLIRLGTGTTPTYATSGYVSQASASSTGTSTAGFIVVQSTALAWLNSGICTISNISGNSWIESGVVGNDLGNTNSVSQGTIALGAVLTAVRITTVNGTDTFDTTPSAGTINILYE